MNKSGRRTVFCTVSKWQIRLPYIGVKIKRTSNSYDISCSGIYLRMTNVWEHFGVGENCCSISAQKTTNKLFVKICWQLKTPTRTWKLARPLQYANELRLRVRLAFQKLLQTRQTSRNYQKQVLVMTKHCLGISQINSIPAWSKEFSYIAFLYRTLAKV